MATQCRVFPGKQRPGVGPIMLEEFFDLQLTPFEIKVRDTLEIEELEYFPEK